MSSGGDVNQELLLKLLAAQQQQQPQKQGLNPNILILAVAILAAAGFWYMSQKQSGNTPVNPNVPVVSTLSQRVDGIFAGSANAEADKLYFGHTMKAVADGLADDQATQKKSFEQVGDIRGPLSGQVSKFVYRPRLKSLPADKANALGQLISEKLQLSGKDADPLTSEQMSQVINWFRELAQASGVK